jgi:arylsulfatase A-like enzyme
MGIRKVTEAEQEAPKPKKGIGSIRAGIWGGIGGALLFVGLFGFSLWMFQGLTYFDVDAEDVQETILEHYKSDLIQQQARILGAYAIIGGALGLFFGLVGAGFLRKDRRKGRIYALICGLLGALLIHVMMMGRALGLTPALYSDWFHEAGPPWQALQGVFTLILVPPVMNVLLVLMILGALGTIARRIAPKAGLFVLAFLLIGCGLGAYMLDRNRDFPRSKTDPAKPNVLILAADSLRPDRLSFFGHSRQTSPAIDRIAREGLVFSDTYVPLARTFPSLASILTGQDPHTHGIRHMFPDPAATRLDGSLGFILAEQGYRTAVIADYAGDVFPRMEAGFETVQAPDFFAGTLAFEAALRLHKMLLPYLDNGPGRKLFPSLTNMADNSDAALLADQIIAAFDEDPDRPFFINAFFSATHFPYTPRYPYYKLYANRNYDGPYKYRKKTELGGVKIQAADIAQVRALFDGCIASFDAQVARIKAEMIKRGIWENTIVLITGDHGESLFEISGEFGHGDNFRRNYTHRVPMILHWPDGFGPIGKAGAQGRFEGLFSSLDFVPTVLANLGIAPPGRIDGKDLTPIVTGDAQSVREAIFAETGLWFAVIDRDYLSALRIRYPEIVDIYQVNDWETGAVTIQPAVDETSEIAKHRMATDGRYKLIYMPVPGGVRYECYDTILDPTETRDLYPLIKSDESISSALDSILDPCLVLKMQLLEWMDSAERAEVRNEYAIRIK